MYHCHLHFYFVGAPCQVFETAKAAAPLERFTHQFTHTPLPEAPTAAQADVILVNLSGQEVSAFLIPLAENKKADAHLILLAQPEQMNALAPWLDRVEAVWPLPLDETLSQFYFTRYQQQRKQEKDLWLYEQLLDRTINGSPNMIWYKDKEGIHHKLNDSFCQVVNKAKEDAEGRDHCYIWNASPEEAEVCAVTDRKVMDSGMTCVAEEVVESSDGTRILTTYKTPLYDLDGAVMGTVGVGVNITQERLYEQEITAKNRSLETIISCLDCGILCHSLDGKRILRVNEAALELLGYTSTEEMLASGFNTVAESVLEEDKPLLREKIMSLKKEGDSATVEYRVRHTDGSILHIMGIIKLVEEDGNLFYHRFLLDVTAQKLQEKEKDRQQAALVQALSIDYNLVLAVNLDTQMAQLLRIDRSQPHLADFAKDSQDICFFPEVEKYISSYIHEDDREAMRSAVSIDRLRADMAERNSHSVNYRLHLDDNVIYCEMKVVRAVAWETSHTVVVGFHSVDEDVRAEMEKKQLLENALVQANLANKAKSLFLSNMSHDIRTPMNAIMGFTSLAISHIDHTTQVEDYLRKIQASGNHMLTLINDVLDMSRIESGRLQLVEIPCNLTEILHDLSALVQVDIQNKAMTLQLDTDSVIDEDFYGDKLRLNQVLLNVLSNAVKYTPEGGSVLLRVTEKAASADRAIYEFCIKDTGIGMSPDFIPRIFEPFEREKNSTTSGIQGTGLGMAITKNIVDMMNGSICVESQLGKGTTVTISLSFRLDSQKRQSEEAPNVWKDERALIIDADPIICSRAYHLLDQLGIRPEWVLTTDEVVPHIRRALMAEDPFQFCLIDWDMPNANVLPLIRQVREEMGPTAHIIILSNYNWSDVEEEVLAAGASIFCSHPLFLPELKACLTTLTAQRQQQAAAQEAPEPAHTDTRILLVEDNALNQEIAQAILEDAGYQVELAENGKVAVEMVSRSRAGYYQVVLMDVQMPVMNGYEATRAIRALSDPALAAIPILAMTANAFSEDKQAALQAGMNGHLAKPIDVKKLFDALDKILG